MRRHEKMIIYNIFPLLAGKFTEWEKHILRASSMDFNWLFINPIQRPGRSGSLYGIADYFTLNPVLIDQKSKKPPDEQVRDIIKYADHLGLKVMVDLVINHCSVDSEMLKTHPQWFMWDSKGFVTHPGADENGKKVVWEDLARFDHRNTEDKEGLYQYFFSIVKYLAELGFRGFRCDAAYQVPRKLWERLINETKKIYPEMLFFAETLGCTPDQTRETADSGFDYIFNSSKWWDFQAPWLMKQYAIMREIAPSISFPESHDTVRLYEELQGRIEGMRQRYLFASLFSSGIMMTMGFEYGFRKKPHVVKTRPEDWEQPNVDLTSYIGRVNQLKSGHPIFQEDAPTEFIHYDNPQILLMWKASPYTREETLVILNKDIHNKQSFRAESLHQYLHAGAPLIDLSPEYALDYIPESFSYDLRPGQGIVLMTTRDSISEEG
ncbi:MAG: alpha-amylase family glycosyl hydrolase [bacterium]